MSFASQAREEIARRSLQKDCCVRAAAYGIACFAKYFDGQRAGAADGTGADDAGSASQLVCALRRDRVTSSRSSVQRGGL